MANRAATFISAICASIIAGAMTASQGAPAASDDCLSGPKGETPQGQHWYYRIDHATKRQCWYLRGEAEKDTQSTAPRTASRSKPADSAAPRSFQDAHAEFPMPQPAADPGVAAAPSAPAVATAAPQALPSTSASDAGAEQPAVATRWPDPPATPPAASAPPAPTIAVASLKQKQQAAPLPTAAAAPVALAAAEVSTDKPTGSIQTLLLVAVGALAIAGMCGRFIYRFAGSRDPARRKAGQRRRVNWEPAIDAGRAPWTPDIAPDADEAPSFAPRGQAEPAALSHALVSEPAREPDRTTSERTTSERQGHDAEADLSIDEITEMLERLLKQGPKLDQPIAAAASADYARSRQGRSDVRA